MSDIKQIGQIIEGHTKKWLDKAGLLPEDANKLGEIRFAICLLCDTQPHPNKPGEKGPGLRDGKYCRDCGCDMEAKTKVTGAKCPIGQW